MPEGFSHRASRAVVAGATVAALLGGGAWLYSKRSPRVPGIACVNHLGQIGRLTELYRIRYGSYPDAAGAEFFERLRSVTEDADLLFRCPLSGRPYRGPVRPLNHPAAATDPQAPVCGDAPGSHGDPVRYGINVLNRGWQVIKVPRGRTGVHRSPPGSARPALGTFQFGRARHGWIRGLSEFAAGDKATPGTESWNRFVASTR